MKRRVLYFLGLYTGVCIPVLGQIGYNGADSLRLSIKTNQRDTVQVQRYLDLGKYYLYQGNQMDSALYFLQNAGTLSKRINYLVGELKYTSLYADVLNRQGKYDQGLSLHLQTVKRAQEKGLKLPLGKAYLNVAVNYSYKSTFDSCLHYNQKALSILEALNAEPELAILYSNLCFLHGHSLHQYDKAIVYGEKALLLAQKPGGNREIVAMAQLNISYALTGAKEYARALVVNQEGYDLARQLNHLHLQIQALAVRGDIYLKLRQYDQMLPVALERLKLAKTIENVRLEALALTALASAYLHVKKYENTKEYAQQALVLSQTHQMKDTWRDNALILSNVELATGNLKAYDDSREESDSLRDAVMNEKLRSNLQELETRYEITKKENRIKQLQKEKEIQLLTIRQKNTVNYIFMGSTVTLLAFGLLFYRQARQAKIIGEQTQRLQQQRIKELEQTQQLVAAHAVLKGQEAERIRLAKDLHDGLGSMLSSIKLTLGRMQGSSDISQKETVTLNLSLEQVDATIRELRRVAQSMMPEALTRFGLAAALQDFCIGLSKSTHLSIDLQLFGLEKRMDSNTEIILYRIVQELLHNVIKHAEATEVLVQLIRSESSLSLTVEDNGKGFDRQHSPEGMGLRNILSRVDFLGGHLDIQTLPEKGTTVTIDLELKGQEALV
jgi:signal transduction histidine kinase